MENIGIAVNIDLCPVDPVGFRQSHADMAAFCHQCGISLCIILIYMDSATLHGDGTSDAICKCTVGIDIHENQSGCYLWCCRILPGCIALGRYACRIEIAKSMPALDRHTPITCRICIVPFPVF